MATTIKFDLSPKSIKAAIRATEGLQAKLDKACDKFCEIVCEKAREIAMENVASLGLLHAQTLTMLESFEIENAGPGKRVLSVKDKAAIYVEFGTGPKGARGEKPDFLPPGWKYGKAWFTDADGKDMKVLYGWKPLETGYGDIFYRTEGQEAKPFWYPMIKVISDETFLENCWKEACRDVGL